MSNLLTQLKKREPSSAFLKLDYIEYWTILPRGEGTLIVHMRCIVDIQKINLHPLKPQTSISTDSTDS